MKQIEALLCFSMTAQSYVPCFLSEAFPSILRLLYHGQLMDECPGEFGAVRDFVGPEPGSQALGWR